MKIDVSDEFESLMKEIHCNDSTLTTFYDVLSVNEALKTLPGHKQPAAHCVIFAKTEKSFFEEPLKAFVMMQMRFDGMIGFAGGLVDPGEEVCEGLNRELKEETNLDINKFGVSLDDFICCHAVKQKKTRRGVDFDWQFNYFFAKEVTEEDFVKIERGCLDSKDHGQECLGAIRAPLHVFRSDGGFPKFLTNHFAGTALTQLLIFLFRKRILSFEEIEAGYKMFHPK